MFANDDVEYCRPPGGGVDDYVPTLIWADHNHVRNEAMVTKGNNAKLFIEWKNECIKMKEYYEKTKVK